jgi:hypothetical protein
MPLRNILRQQPSGAFQTSQVFGKVTRKLQTGQAITRKTDCSKQTLTGSHDAPSSVGFFFLLLWLLLQYAAVATKDSCTRTPHSKGLSKQIDPPQSRSLDNKGEKNKLRLAALTTTLISAQSALHFDKVQPRIWPLFAYL